jgi:flavin reductase (DIM6/NTAB) family NADH-FMN oxidoreductase RutF
MSTVNETQFKNAMKHLAASVTLITTTSEDGAPAGMTATAVCSLSANPARLLICVNRATATHRMIHESRRFCVNVLSDGQKEISQDFANPDARELRFTKGRWSKLKSGAPAMLDALVAFDCEVFEVVEAETHSIFIGDIVDTHQADDATPLLYFRGNFVATAGMA